MFGDIVKMTQASAQMRDEAEGREALGIDLITIADLDIDEIRAAIPGGSAANSASPWCSTLGGRIWDSTSMSTASSPTVH